MQAHWPAWAPNEETIPAFIQAFEGLGYSPSVDHVLEPAVEKIAIYATNNIPTHASRQLVTGEWSSKLGESYDFSHTINCMDGPAYGTAVIYMRRPRRHNLSDDVIAPIAYRIWEHEGHQHGHDFDHWFRAIQQILVGQTTALQAPP